jgi:hypothetical protein
MKFVGRCKVCVRNGDLEGLKKLSSNLSVRKWKQGLDELAASISQSEIVEWLYQNNYRMRWHLVIDEACKVKCRKILEFAYRTESYTGITILLHAISFECSEILDWSQTLNPPIPLNWYMIIFSIEYGRMKSLEWLLLNGCPFGDFQQKFDFEFERTLLEKVTRHTQNVEEVWKLWKSFGDEECSRHEKYVEWPPEEVMKDVIELMTLSLISEL